MLQRSASPPFFIPRCVKNDSEDRLRAAADPRKHETAMVAEPGSTLSLMVTTDAVVAPPFRLGKLSRASSDPAARDAAVAAAALQGVRLGLCFSVGLGARDRERRMKARNGKGGACDE